MHNSHPFSGLLEFPGLPQRALAPAREVLCSCRMRRHSWFLAFRAVLGEEQVFAVLCSVALVLTNVDIGVSSDGAVSRVWF